MLNDYACTSHRPLVSRARAQAAEEALLLVQNERYKSEYCYISWLAR